MTQNNNPEFLPTWLARNSKRPRKSAYIHKGTYSVWAKSKELEHNWGFHVGDSAETIRLCIVSEGLRLSSKQKYLPSWQRAPAILPCDGRVHVTVASGGTPCTLWRGSRSKSIIFLVHIWPSEGKWNSKQNLVGAFSKHIVKFHQITTHFRTMNLEWEKKSGILIRIRLNPTRKRQLTSQLSHSNSNLRTNPFNLKNAQTTNATKSVHRNLGPLLVGLCFEVLPSRLREYMYREMKTPRSHLH